MEEICLFCRNWRGRNNPKKFTHFGAGIYGFQAVIAYCVFWNKLTAAHFYCHQFSSTQEVVKKEAHFANLRR